MNRGRIYLVRLGSGRHPHPRTGGCLLELAGTLTGEPWTDHPVTVPRELSLLARRANDRSGPDGRHRLLPLLPWLVDRRAARPSTYPAAIALAAARAAAPVADPAAARRLVTRASRLVAEAEAAEMEKERPAGWATRSRHRRQVWATVRAVAALTAQAPQSQRDHRLLLVLLAALNRSRQLAGHDPLDFPPVPGSAGSPGSPTGLEIMVWPVAADGNESWQLRCSALTDRWPDPLQDGWIRRRAELSSRRPAEGSARDPADRAAGTGCGSSDTPG